jgi:hypothetical protein
MWHAGLPFPEPGADLPKGSMSAATWTLTGIEEACGDLLHALERLNVEMNGAVPSEVGMDRKVNDFSRLTVWSVERILDQMEEALEKSRPDDQRQLIDESIQKVKFWWRCVLEGDVDDIRSDWQRYLQSQ